jgi:hypothetical protein
MLAIQIKAFGLLLAVLLVVDALAFQGAYREEYGGRALHFLAAISPANWTGFGSGHDWGDQKPRPHR